MTFRFMHQMGVICANKQLTINIVFLSMTKMPSILNPIGSPFRRLRNTFTYIFSRKELDQYTTNKCVTDIMCVCYAITYGTCRLYKRHNNNENIGNIA